MSNPPKLAAPKIGAVSFSVVPGLESATEILERTWLHQMATRTESSGFAMINDGSVKVVFVPSAVTSGLQSAAKTGEGDTSHCMTNRTER